MNDEVIDILLDYKVARTVSRHAIVVYHLLNNITKVSYTSKTIACACLLYTLKERNKTHLVSNLRELRSACNDCEVVALELFLIQTIRRKILLIEGCIRLALKKLIDLHPELGKFKEDLVLIALFLTEKLYRNNYCLWPESAAMATLITACNLLALGSGGLSPKLQTQQVSEMNMISELDDQLALNDGYLLESRIVGKKAHNIENPCAYRDLFFEFSSSSLVEKAIAFSEKCTCLLKHECSKYSTTLEDIYKNRSHRLKLSLDASRKVREFLSKAVYFFQESIPPPPSVSAFDLVALLSVALAKDPSENAKALLKSFSHEGWHLGSPNAYLEIFCLLRLDENALPCPLRYEYRAAKFDLALRTCRLSPILDCLLCDDARECALVKFKPPKIPQKILYTEESLESFLYRSYTLPFCVKGASVLCSLYNNSLTLFLSREMISYEMVGLMETRLQKIKEESLELSPGEQIVSFIKDTLITVQPISPPYHAGKSQYSIRMHDLTSKKVLKSGRLVFCGANFYLWNAERCLFSFCAGTLVVLRHTSSPTLSRRCLYVCTVPLDSVFESSDEYVISSEGMPLMRNPSNPDDNKALYFTKSASVSVGRVTLKGGFTPFCIELWVYPCAVSEVQTLISIGDKRVDEIFIEIEPCSDGVIWRGGARTPRLGQSFAMFTTSGKAYLRRWWHVSLNFTGTTWELWLDDRFVAVQSALLSPQPIQDAKCTLCKCFVGFLSEVRIWCYARSAVELLRDANERLGGSEKGLCGYFRLNEGGGDFVTDYSLSREHVLMAHGELHWCVCPPAPIASSWNTGPECLIPDFLPLSQKDDFESLHFSVSPRYFTVAVATRGPTLCIYQYNRVTYELVAQIRLHLTGNMKIIGIWWNSTHLSTQCGAVSESAPDQLIIWEIGEYNQICLHSLPEGECSLWSYGRVVLLQSAEYTQPYLNSERFLIDGNSWRLSVPTLVVDANPNTLHFLLKLAEKAISEGDRDLAHAACVLLHMNLLFLRNSTAVSLTQELGSIFSDAFELLAVIDADKSELGLPALRDRIVKLAFSTFAEDSGLLEICCYCFLSEPCRIQFVKTTSGKRRVRHEERLFWCLVGLYQSLRYCHEVYEKNEHIEVLFKALILESASQVDIGVRQKKSTGLKQVSRCLELLQEVLFDKITENPEKTELKELCINYTKSLLKACEKISESARKTLQSHPKIEQPLLQCLKLSPIGSLLTSFTLSLPFLPTSILVTCQAPIQECQTALLSITRSISEKVMWMSELCIAMTFSLCLVGCTLLRANSLSTTDNPEESKYTLESKYLNILRGGPRKCGTERDLLIKNIQQGVGPIGIAFEKLQLRDNFALRMVRDEQLRRVERCIMAAVCALTLPTSELKKATPESLEPAFQHVLRMRPYIISKRQELKENLVEIENRSVFFAQFEPCVHTEKDPKTTQSSIVSRVSKSARKTMHRDVASWRRLFKNWKVMRLLKTLTFSQEENDSTHIGSDIVDFLQSSVIKCVDVKKFIEFRTRKAHCRLSGLLTLKQLVDEARVNASLSFVILPVISKNLCAWHYSDGVECCSSEDIFRLHGSFFQLFDAMLNKYLDNGGAEQQKNDHRERYHWGVFLLSLIISLRRQIDFRKVRSNLVGMAFRSIMKNFQANALGYRPRVNGMLPIGFRETKLDASLAAVNIKIGDSGLTVKSNGGRGSCLAPCKWTAPKNRESSYVFYYEVYVVDLLPGAMCSVGVGPFDCRLFRLPGWEPNSFSLLSDEGVLFTGKPTGRVTGNSFSVGDVLGCGWNAGRREIYWTKNGKFLLSTSAGEAATFSPVVGLDGKGVVQVNFGNSPFCFDAWHEAPLQIVPTQHKGYFKWTGTDAWDAYRTFTLRAATCLCEAAARPNTSSEALSELASCVEHCLETLSEEIMHTCKQAEGAVSNPQSTSTFYLRVLLRHCGILTQLLGQVSRKYIAASRVVPLANTLEIIALSLLQPSIEVERSVSLVSLAPLMDSDILMVLLTTWYHTMNLVPPGTYVSLEGATSCSSPGMATSRFLSILLGLASRLCIDNRLSSSKRRDSTTQVIPLLVEYLPDGVYWMALSLLQHLNGAGDKDGRASSGQPDIDISSNHTWCGALNEWMITVLSKNHQPNRDVLLALFILGGGPRLPVPGDMVNVMRTKRTVSKASLISISLSEEICEVMDNGVHRVLPLRLVDLIIADDESNYYPARGLMLHQRQAIEVLSLALRLMASGSWGDFDGSALLAHLMSVLWRCTVRRVIGLPKSIIAMLSLSVKSVEVIPVDLRQLRMDKVFTESCSAGKRHPTTPLFSPMNNTSEDFSSTFGTYDLVSPINFTGPQWRFPAYLSDPGIDVDDEEHDDNIDSNEGEDMSDEVLSSIDNINLSVSMSSDALLKDESFQTAIMKGAYDAIRFDRGYLCVRADRCIGLNYTLDLQIYIQDLLRPQIIFAQHIFVNPAASPVPSEAKALEKDVSWLLVARLVDFSIEYGIIPSNSLNAALTTSLVENICRIPLTPDDTARWIRLTFVGSGTSLSLYREGVLRDIKRIGAMAGSLLQHELFFGGLNTDTRTLLHGCLRSIRIYDVAMHEGMVGQLQPISFSLLAFTEPRLCLIILAQRDGFKNYSRSPVSVLADISAHGEVSFLENSALPPRKGANFCAHELDYGNDPDEQNLFMIETSWLVNFTQTYLAFIKSKRELSLGLLWVSYRRCLRQLITFYSIAILAELLYQLDWNKAPYPEWITVFDSSNDEVSVIKDILHYTFITGNTALYGLVQNMLQAIARSNKSTPLITALRRDALQSLLQTAQREECMHTYESPHPLTPSLTKTTHEICCEGQNYYQFFFDSRSSSSNIVLTFSLDKAFLSVIAQTPGFALTPFTVQLPRVYFDVRTTSTVPQWGYKMFVVTGCLPQLRAVRLIRAMLTTALEYEHLHHFPLFKTSACLKQMSHCATVNTGKTRRIILSCLTDLLLRFEPFNRADMSSVFSTIHEIRRMAERRYRQHLTAQLHVTHCRFLQVVMECYTFFMDAWRCWGDSKNPLANDATVLTPSQEQMLFAQCRLEQRMLYRFRDNGKERVMLQKNSDAHHLHLDWTSDICVARNDGVCASMIAQVSLVRGKWYFEVRIGGAGNSFIGVLPSASTHSEGFPREAVNHFAFNGFNGLLQSADGTTRSIASRETWQHKDYVGVVLDMDEKMCHFLINGKDENVSFSFDSEEGRAAAAAAWPEPRDPEYERILRDAAFFPYFSLEEGELMFINFGASHFEYEIPCGCLPLDPANLMLGALLSYNQLRAYQDLLAHLLTGGSHPMPPFYYEEADPFAHSIERKGPAHVSLHSSLEGVEINLLEVKNTGTSFQTVTADCSVLLGCWYYEVTLHTQGLMQIGWITKSNIGKDSVGDTPLSWSIDLFRRVRWHKGIAEPLAISRRWSVGDVIGCALNLSEREMTFFLNGRSIGITPLTSCTFHSLPVGSEFEYVPAISLRAGNHVSFNFGSSPFKCKPDGFSALGVPDSWCERIDTFYGNERPTSTLRRVLAVQQLCRPMNSLERASAKAKFTAHLQSYQTVVDVVDRFCQEPGKVYMQITQESFEAFYKKDMPSPNTACNEGSTGGGELTELWIRFLLLKAVARLAQTVLPFLNINTQNASPMTRLFLYTRTILFRQLRVNMVDNMLKETNVHTEHLRLSINRTKARAERQVFGSSVFGQTLSLLMDRPPLLFQNNKRFWSTTFMGEGAEDVGGPFREHINEICQELMSTNLPLFVPTANNIHNLGKCRGAFVPAASATGQLELAAYVFLGNLMGGAIRSEEPLSLFFPSLVWKYMCCYPIVDSDLDEVDHICWQCIQEFQNAQSQLDGKEAFNEAFDAEYFVTKLSDTTTKELIENGANVKVTYDRCGEYAEALLKARLHEFDLQLSKIREGLLQVVPELVLLLLSPAELEVRVCGQPDFEIDELRKSAVYEGLTSEDRRVLLLWAALEEATPKQRRLFLRFVSGRDRMPVKLRVLPLPTPRDPNMFLPRAATCFFALELPDYSSLEVMKEKLYYSIENCLDIDTDFNARQIVETEGPRLVVGIDGSSANPLIERSNLNSSE